MINAKEPQNQKQFDEYSKRPVVLGPYTSYIFRTDPKHLGFLFARYKFVAKMLAQSREVLEVGCGDGVGTAIVAKEVGKVYATDFEPLLTADNKRRLSDFPNISFSLLDITKKPFFKKCDAAFSMDVVEHINPNDEMKFFKNICKSLKKSGVCIIGTPNREAKMYATPGSRQGHVNLKSHVELRNLLKIYFQNGMIFSMNDEMVHTGFYPMAHYLLMVGIGVKHEAV